MPLLQMQDIRKRFGATIALDGVSFDVAPGEVHALVGQNGAGKSTLMKVLSGAHAPDSGTMTLDNAPYAPRNPLHGRHLGVGMIYQELSLAPHLSVMENILLGMEPWRLGFIRWGQMKATALAALTQLGHAHLSLSQPVSQLSPAQQQIVEIARALAVGCKVLVLDEPTSSLTQQDVAKLYDTIRTLSARGIGIVYISHFLEEIKTIAHRFTVLRDGKTVGSGEVATTSPQQMVELMVGRAVNDLYPRSVRAPGENVLDIAALSGRSKPTEISLALRRGEVLGIAGLIGAGRTELLRALFGLDPIRSGNVSITHLQNPSSLAKNSPASRWRNGVGMLSEDRKNEGLALAMSIADNLTLSDLKPFGPAGFIVPARQKAAANLWADRLLLKRRSVMQPVGDLSGGNQQKVAIARLLHHHCDILLLDEPTRGIDVGSKAAIYALIDQLAKGTADTPPKAVLVVSSYFPELLGIADRIAVMAKGKLVDLRPTADWTEHQLVLAAASA